ncbi:MAG: hypothetical protein IKI94_07165, partial [Ruminococcus sp.]|nr:hypothetical protein [Ruminococcus sp.]
KISEKMTNTKFLFFIFPAAAYAIRQTGKKRYRKKSLEKTIELLPSRFVVLINIFIYLYI